MIKKILFAFLLSLSTNLYGQKEFLMEMQTYKNVFELGILDDKASDLDVEQVNSNDYNELMELASQHMGDGDFRISILVLKKALQIIEERKGEDYVSNKTISKINPYPTYLIGINYHFLSELDSALSYFKLTLSEAPFYAPVFNGIGNVYMGMNQMDSAIYYFTKGFNLDKKSDVLIHNLGLANLKIGQEKEALKYFMMNIGINPEFQASYVMAAAIHERKEVLHMAELFYSKAIILSENNPYSLAERGYYYLRQKDYERAYLDFENAYLLDSGNQHVVRQLGLLELYKENYVIGMDFISRSFRKDSIEKNDQSVIRNDYEDAEIKAILKLFANQKSTTEEKELTGRFLSEVLYDKEHNVYTKANEYIRSNPDSELVNRIWLYSKSSLYLGKREISWMMVNNYISKIDSVLVKFRRPELILLKGRILFNHRLERQTIKQMDDLIALNPNFAIAHYYKAAANYNLQKYEQAILSYTKLLEVIPDWTFVRNERGLTYMQIKKFESAIDDFRVVIRENPESAESCNSIGVCFYNLEMIDSALYYYNKSIQKDPKQLFPYINRGDIYFANGQFERALLEYNESILLNSEFYEAKAKRAEVFMKIGELQFAVNDFLSALRYLQQDKHRGKDRGDSYQIVERYQEANKMLINKLGEGEESEVVSPYKEAEVEICHEYSENYASIGFRLAFQEEYEKAMSYFDIALALDPNNHGVYELKARAHLYLEKYEAAYRYYRIYKSLATEEEIKDIIYFMRVHVANSKNEDKVQYIIRSILSD